MHAWVIQVQHLNIHSKSWSLIAVETAIYELNVFAFFIAFSLIRHKLLKSTIRHSIEDRELSGAQVRINIADKCKHGTSIQKYICVRISIKIDEMTDHPLTTYFRVLTNLKMVFFENIVGKRRKC